MVRPMSVAGSLKRRPWRIGGFWFLTPLVCAIAISGCASPQVATAQKSNRPLHANSYKAWHRTLDEMRQKAEQGDQEAQYELGRLYKTGLAGSRDAQEAEKWYRLAAEQGHREAQYSLAALYASGIGIPRDMPRASKWYRLAAEQGHADAQFSLATLYEFGQGVTRDDQQAMKWYRLAAEQGHEMATVALCKWETTCQSTKWQARQRRRQEQFAREKERVEAEAREQQRKLDEAQKLGERLGTIGIAVIPSYKRIMEKEPTNTDSNLPIAEELPGAMAAGFLYGGPLGMIAAPPAIGLAYVLQWISDGIERGTFQSKEEVRQAKAAIKNALQNTRIAEQLQAHTLQQLSSNLGSKVVSLDQPRDVARITDGKYDKLREQNIGTLIMFDDLRIGLVGSDDSAMFVMRADILVIDVVHKLESHKQILNYAGDSLQLSNWIDNDADTFLSELQKAYGALAEDAVNGVIAALSMPSIESNATEVAKIEQRITSTRTINCKTRYCGNYYGFLVIKGQSQIKLPIKITVNDGTITSAISANSVGTCRTTNADAKASLMASSGEFFGKYKAVCEFKKMEPCQVIGKLKGYVNSPSNPIVPDELLLSGSSMFSCSHGNHEFYYSVSTTQSASGIQRTSGEVEKMLINSDTGPFIERLLSAGMKVINLGQ